VAAQEKVWRELQDALAALAPGAQHVIATKSGHDIQNTEPDLVITAVRQVVDAARGYCGAQTLVKWSNQRGSK
jgi:pimeloyl-ACP methyl ester carboxylesterase